jgi:hypothetical protein
LRSSADFFSPPCGNSKITTLDISRKTSSLSVQRAASLSVALWSSTQQVKPDRWLKPAFVVEFSIRLTAFYCYSQI